MAGVASGYGCGGDAAYVFGDAMTGRKTKQFIIHCTAAQHALVKAHATAAGVPISRWLTDLLNAGWRATSPAKSPAPKPVRSSAEREALAQADGIVRALSWLPTDGSWSAGPAPWQISNRLTHLRRRGFVESRVVCAYPTKLNWRISEPGRLLLARSRASLSPAAVMSTSPGDHPSLPDPAFSASSGTDTVRVEDLK